LAAVVSHILDFEPVDINERTPVDLEFLFRLRDEVQWPSIDALKAQIFKDVATAKRFFRLAR
jgi:riboflavin kinase/FMN adenylyltransferase